MGNSSSAEKFLATPLSKQREFPFTLNVRFCKPRETTIVLTDNFWGRVANDDTFTVRELSGRELFHVAASAPNVAADPNTKWLLDAYKIPVAHMTEARTYTTAYNVHIGKDADYCLTQIEVQFIPMHNNPCRAETQNLDTGDRSRVGVHGLWRQRTVFIYLDRENNGGRQAIARVFRPDVTMRGDFGDSEYHVTVAAGVDVAFVVLVCAAMDDALRQRIDAD
ncbi:hypothetical protein Gpo141_00011705 [Globisporangium polare]